MQAPYAYTGSNNAPHRASFGEGSYSNLAMKEQAQSSRNDPDLDREILYQDAFRKRFQIWLNRWWALNAAKSATDGSSFHPVLPPKKPSRSDR